MRRQAALLTLAAAAVFAVLVPAAAAVDSGTKVCAASSSQPCTIEIRLKLQFSPAEKSKATKKYWKKHLNQWAKIIEKGIEGEAAKRNITTAGGCKVVFDVDADSRQIGEPPRSDYHQIKLHFDKTWRDYSEDLQAPGGSPVGGEWSVNKDKPSQVAPSWLHESMHLVGLRDQYMQTGTNTETGKTFDDPDIEILSDMNGKPVDPGAYNAFLARHNLNPKDFPLNLVEIEGFAKPGHENSVMADPDSPGSTLAADELDFVESLSEDCDSEPPDDSGKHCYDVAGGPFWPFFWPPPDPPTALPKYFGAPTYEVGVLCSFKREAEYLKAFASYVTYLADQHEVALNIYLQKAAQGAPDVDASYARWQQAQGNAQNAAQIEMLGRLGTVTCELLARGAKGYRAKDKQDVKSIKSTVKGLDGAADSAYHHFEASFAPLGAGAPAPPGQRSCTYPPKKKAKKGS